MQTTPDTAALLRELYERASIVTELQGPQLEAWVSGLFPVFDDQLTPGAFVEYCATRKTEQGALIVAAIGELAEGLDPHAAAVARSLDAGPLPTWADTIGASRLTGAWSVVAKFGTSIVLGFDTPAQSTDLNDDAVEDLRHAILVELDDTGALVDLQLTGPAALLVDEAMGDSERVTVEELATDEALATIRVAWPAEQASASTLGTGFMPNQQFVRRRLLMASGHLLSHVQITPEPVDLQRGMTDAEYAEANRAAVSTLRSAIGMPDAASDGALADHVAAWVAVVRGDVVDVSPRERDALLWLEWADWLGAGIGMFRSGPDTAVDGAALVDFVNRCPEVSSSIDKADRDYAEWAFEIALDLLHDQGVTNEDRRLTDEGHASLHRGLVAAWS